MNVSSPASTIGFVTRGRLRALARTGDKRGKVLPDVPTVAESGYPGFEAIQWYGLSCRPHAEAHRCAHSRRHAEGAPGPDVQDYMDRLGLEPGHHHAARSSPRA